MSSGIAKIGDIAVGVCYAHESPVSFTAVIITGATTVIVNGAGAGVVGAIALSDCGHPVTLITGSLTVLSESGPTHRLGDIGVNAGGTSTTINGSSNVISG